MADFTFKVSPNIILGSYSVSRLGQFALDWGTQFMVIMDPVLKEVGISEKILKSLDDRKINYFIFDELKESSDTQTINRALDLARNSQIHGVIAVGGNKAFNIARAVCAVFHEVHDLYTFVDESIPLTNPLPLICVSTTNRDAFVFSNKIPVIDSRSMETKIVKLKWPTCKLVIFDPQMTVSLTENQSTSLSLESLCLAVESFLSQKSSFFSEMFSEKAVELLSYEMDGPNSLSITTPRDELFVQAGILASLACATSSFGPANLLALTINSRFNITKSLVSAMMLPYVIEDCAKFKIDRVVNLAEKFNLEISDGLSNEEICKSFADNIRKRLAKANLPVRLKDLSLSIDQLAMAAEDAGKLEYINSLPRSMSSDELFEFLKLAY